MNTTCSRRRSPEYWRVLYAGAAASGYYDDDLDVDAEARDLLDRSGVLEDGTSPFLTAGELERAEDAIRRIILDQPIPTHLERDLERASEKVGPADEN